MGRATLPTLALLAPALALATPMDTAVVPGVDVLARCQALVADMSVSAQSPTPSYLPLAANAVPTDVAAALAKHSINWSALSDVMRVGVLWAHGYMVPGGSQNSGSLVKVYTSCPEGTGDIEAVGGRFMDDIALSGDQFAADKCAKYTCGNFFQATNDKCAGGLAQDLLCAVDAKGLPTSNESFWADAGNGSTAVPYPQLYLHTLAVANDATPTLAANATTPLNLVSIHMRATTTGNTACSNTGDAIVPCVVLADVANAASFCRPKVDGVRLKAFFDVVTKHLADAAAAAAAATKTSEEAKSSGLSTGAIVGIVGGAVVVLGIVAFYFFRTKRKASKHTAGSDRGLEGFGRKSTTGVGGNAVGANAQGFHAARGGKTIQRQGTSNTFPLMDSSRDNDTVCTTDYVGADNNLDEDSRQRPFSHRLLKSTDSLTDSLRRPRNSSVTGSMRGASYGKTVEEYCEESDVIRDFVHDPQINIQRIPYEELTILRVLSKGSYGEVFLGQLETRHIAMKRLLPEKKHLTKSIEQFMGEIQIMCNLEHRNIVTFVGVSWDYLQNISVIVEYMDNGDLAEVLAKSKTKYTWPKEKMSISMDIAEGLVYLHSMRPVIVHRDLKSKNVLLNKRGQAKLSDFGVSRKTNVNETMTSGVGTLLWTAPEIIEGRKYSEKADIFSLGVVLSEIDTCEEPYSTVKNEETGERLPGMQIVQMVRLGQLSINFRADCPPKLRELAEQCTDLDPDKRPTSMEVAYTLKSIIAPSLRVTSST